MNRRTGFNCNNTSLSFSSVQINTCFRSHMSLPFYSCSSFLFTFPWNLCKYMQTTEWVSDTALFFNLLIKWPKDSVYGEVISVPQKSMANCLAYRNKNNSNRRIIKINLQDLQNTFLTRKVPHTELLHQSLPD